MKITRRQLRRLIKEELSRLNESISVDTLEDLERVLKVAYKEGIGSYHPKQRVIGIPGKTEDRPVDPDPHTEIVNSLTSLVRSILDNMPGGYQGFQKDSGPSDGPLDDEYPKHLGYKHPETGEQVMIMVQTSDDMDDILDPLLRQYPDLLYSVD